MSPASRQRYPRSVAALRMAIGGMGVVLLVQGLLWGFFPGTNMDTYGITADGALGLNMIKADIGGPLIATGLMLVLFAVRGGYWFLPTVILAGSYLGVRTASLIVDGPEPLAVLGVVVEAVVVAALYALHRLWTRDRAGDGGKQSLGDDLPS